MKPTLDGSPFYFLILNYHTSVSEGTFSIGITMTVPSDRNIALKETEKKCKHKDLELEIQRMWHMKTVVIPVVVGALGTVKKGMVENIKKVSERANMTEIQKICMLGSARILRKVLSV